MMGQSVRRLAPDGISTPDREPFQGTYFRPRDSHGRPGFAPMNFALSQAWKSQTPKMLLTFLASLEQFSWLVELDQQVICRTDRMHGRPAS